MTRLSILLVLISFSCGKIDRTSVDTPPKVLLVAVGEFEAVKLDAAYHAITTLYGFEATIGHHLDFPDDCYVNIKTPRYRADCMLRHLRKIMPDSFDYIMAVTSNDISTTKKGVRDSSHKYFDWGIFGLGNRPGPASIISSYRLGKDWDQSNQRMATIAAHELGHNLGLKHCVSGQPCLMVDAAEKIATVDRAPYRLCAWCKEEIGIKKP